MYMKFLRPDAASLSVTFTAPASGAAWLAILSKLPAVPMSISGSGVFFPRLAKIVTPGLAMRMTIGKPIATEAMRSADRTELTHRLEEAVRATFTTEV